MKGRYGKFNAKRRLKSFEHDERGFLEQLVKEVKYGGNPEHKMHPGDFGLTPPSSPRLGKSLCDDVGIKTRADALELLKRGLSKGLVSDRFSDRWPKNIWSVTDEGKPLEAQLENEANGTYHGYPMPDNDPFASEVLRMWSCSDDV